MSNEGFNTHIKEPRWQQVVSVVIALLAVAAIWWYETHLHPITETFSDYRSAQFVIEGQKVALTGDAKFFGNELKTDLDGDGREDVAFIITRSPGGSGTFYYAVSALNKESGWVGSDGYLLGDRIAPQSTTISPNPNQKYVVVFNYADRAASEPMTASPSVGKSAYLKLDPATMQWGIVEPNFEGESN